MVLLSSLTESLNPNLEARLKQIIQLGKARLGYIPSQYDRERFYFEKMKPNLERIGFREFLYCDIDQEHDEENKERLHQCDAVFLSGGNTFYFLGNLQKRGLVSFLTEYVRDGGMLIGVSAGAMVMSTTIDVAGIIDPNDVQLEDTRGFDLVQLHFLPHYSKEVHWDDLENFSKRHELPVYGCKDDSGIIVEDDRVERFGQVVKIG
ncbi:Type 1 glutamine amidotransferase-like domain-containing protein [Alkalihalobacillus sp. AL-G]|uniref:Type 1 glutamine amidotransferase-like domain-containing protein n=1 Tax=Alkalihalobacillus sp. AL-G TaxID=2926399 RepID=UPI00272B62F7|nr:Type 1 glutamine amidotransferase-like domain-containing protein [Alkalihalobacillus sp. AL-G]WLD95306.1 Type 1 glutamine amidotransferase-like domain-containing protein [Alkalihalobacillus sp. AL-G]